jgi:F-type H+-transporting ATPase subunit delta
MRRTSVARRYARALFSLAADQDAVDSTRAELAGMAELLASNPEFERRLFRPLHPVKERRGVLEGVCERGGSSRTVRNFFAYLIDQRRLIDFDAIREEFERLADEAAGQIRAEVLSASPLGDAQRARLVEALVARTGKRVELSLSVDPTLIGGAVARVGGLVFDGSLRTQLSQLGESLMRTGSRH